MARERVDCFVQLLILTLKVGLVNIEALLILVKSDLSIASSFTVQGYLYSYELFQDLKLKRIILHQKYLGVGIAYVAYLRIACLGWFWITLFVLLIQSLFGLLCWFAVNLLLLWSCVGIIDFLLLWESGAIICLLILWDGVDISCSLFLWYNVDIDIIIDDFSWIVRLMYYNLRDLELGSRLISTCIDVRETYLFCVLIFLLLLLLLFLFLLNYCWSGISWAGSFGMDVKLKFSLYCWVW